MKRHIIKFWLLTFCLSMTIGCKPAQLNTSLYHSNPPYIGDPIGTQDNPPYDLDPRYLDPTQYTKRSQSAQLRQCCRCKSRPFICYRPIWLYHYSYGKYHYHSYG